MFVQVLQGPVGDELRLRAQLDRWLAEQAPQAKGWLGGTYGITDDGTFVGVVRFESAEAARRNADRPDQSRWWQETASCFDGEVAFHDFADARVLLQGGSDTAGFVQVIQGRVADRERLVAMEEEGQNLMRQYRPDIIGATVGVDDDGFFTETVAFVSEEAARQGERNELPEDARQMVEEENALMQDVRYLDLRHPWFASAGSAGVPGQRQVAAGERPQPTA